MRLKEAVANRLGHAEFMELICQDEINVRQQRLMERSTRAADFRGLKRWKTSIGASIQPSKNADWIKP